MPVNFWYNGDLCVKTSSMCKHFTAIVQVVFEIFGENPISNLKEFWIKQIWHEMNFDITGSTPLYEKQEYRMKNVHLLALFHGYINIFWLFFFPYQPWMTKYTVVWVKNPYFIEQKCQIRKIVSLINLVKCVTHFAYKCTAYVAKWQLIKALML